ncbi:TIGR04222 domain-containing membrane protein [Streptomyces tricolor]|uniref:TIGR04222 domain-containing membrane protein n=1 Tax=Streptomyces tricolor TaxID=68277 RepID=UPI000A361F4A|nr:TIGR04222 domain-containing membrane protein [Streptomyces tricolor]
MLDQGVGLAALVLTAGAIGYRLVVAVRIAVMLRADVTVREDLSAEELAFLAGGPRRAVVTVLFRMAGQGRLSVAEDGTVTVRDGGYAPDAAAGIEKALVVAAGVSRSERAGKLVAEAAASRAVRSVGERLQAEGLLIAPSLRRGQFRARRLLWWAAALAPALTVWDLTAGTRERWWAGVALSALATATATLVKPAQDRAPYRVRSLLDTLRAEPDRPAPWRPPGALTALAVTPVGAVALGGLAASREPVLGALITPETWRAGDPAHGGDSGGGWGTSADWGSCGYAGGCGAGGGGGGCGSAGA